MKYNFRIFSEMVNLVKTTIAFTLKTICKIIVLIKEVYIEHPYLEHSYLEHPYLEHPYLEPLILNILILIIKFP